MLSRNIDWLLHSISTQYYNDNVTSVNVTHSIQIPTKGWTIESTEGSKTRSDTRRS